MLMLSRGCPSLVLCRACLWLHLIKLIEYVERGHTGLMLCWQLKSMNWIKTQMLVYFDAILSCFLLTWDAFRRWSWNQALICSCLGFSCLRFLYFAALTYWPAWLILCLNFCAFYSWLFCPVSTQLKKKSVQSRGPIRSRLWDKCSVAVK